jgi:acetylglutamate kinase
MELAHFLIFLRLKAKVSFIKSATKLAESMGLVPQMIDGRRITDAAMLEVVVMIYAGQINKIL